VCIEKKIEFLYQPNGAPAAGRKVLFRYRRITEREREMHSEKRCGYLDFQVWEIHKDPNPRPSKNMVTEHKNLSRKG